MFDHQQDQNFYDHIRRLEGLLESLKSAGIESWVHYTVRKGVDLAMLFALQGWDCTLMTVDVVSSVDHTFMLFTVYI